MEKIKKAEEALRKGRVIIIYDGDEREGEADLVFHASFVTPKMIELLRKDGGGLICLALSNEIAERFGIPFYTELLRKAGFDNIACKKTAYGDEPAFSISVNHKTVYTGITDIDRAITIKEIANAAESSNPKGNFIENFYSPGHVFLLISRGIEKRRGHTELAVELARRAGMSGVMVLCEMLGVGRALQKKKAEEYARKKGFVFIEGVEIYEARNR